MTTLDRRRFLRGTLALGGGALAPTLAALPVGAATAAPGESPYGPLGGIEPDDNGIILPPGFTSRVIAVAGERVAGTDHAWHVYPDGAATFPDGTGGWYYACNSEVFSTVVPAGGGVGAIHFGPNGDVLDAYPILTGSHSNCAGGPTPWGTWLSCEEDPGDRGLVWECDPSGAEPAVAHEAMGRWRHEAAAVDPVGRRVYMTQDHSDGVLYRFTPAAYPDLSSGLLEAAKVTDGQVAWIEVPDPTASSEVTRKQVPDATRFLGGEGIWYHDGFVFFTTKHDNSVHAVNVRRQTYELIWRANPDLDVEAAVLTGVDNITASTATGDLYVAEDGGNMEVVIITPDGAVAPFCQVVGHRSSEITGPCFDPSGTRMYFSSQRGPTPKTLGQLIPGVESDIRRGGITFEITGPFHGTTPPTTTSTSTTPPTTTTTTSTTMPPTTTTTTSTTTASTTSTTTTAAGTTSTSTIAAGTTAAAPTTVASSAPSPVTTLAASNPSSVAAGDDNGGVGAGVGIGLGLGAAAAIGALVFAVRSRSAADDTTHE